MKAPIEEILLVALSTPMGDPADETTLWGLNTLLWGTPGIRKSAVINQVSKSCGLPLYDLYPATRQPEDVSGAAFLNSTKLTAVIEALLGGVQEIFSTTAPNRIEMNGLSKVTNAVGKIAEKALRSSLAFGQEKVSIEALLPGIHMLMQQGRGVLFIDELSCASEAKQAAFMNVVLARKVADTQLPPKVRVLSAANPPDSATGGWELGPAFANRFTHIQVDAPSHAAWSDWLLGKYAAVKEITDFEERVVKNWERYQRQVKLTLQQFMLRNPSITFKTSKGSVTIDPLNNLPPEGDPNRGKAWPSPRTWFSVNQIITTCLCLDASESVRDALVAGSIGDEVFSELLSYMTNLDLPTTEEVMAGKWEPDTKRLDRSVLVYNSLVDYIKSKAPEAQSKLAEKTWKIFHKGCVAGLSDILIPCIQDLVQKGFSITHKDADVAKMAEVTLGQLYKAGMQPLL